MPITKRGNFDLKGKAYWCFNKNPNKYNRFQVNLCLDDPEQEAKARDLGLNVKEKNDFNPHPFVIIKKKKVDDYGNVTNFIPTFKKSGEQEESYIGNGSDIAVEFIAAPYSGSNGTGVYTVLDKITVLDLVEFTPNSDNASSNEAPF